MAHEHKFFKIALRLCHPDCFCSDVPEELAAMHMAGRLTGCNNIGEFIDDGVSFFENIEANANEAIAKLEAKIGSSETNVHVIAALNCLIDESKELDRNTFLTMLADDWRDRYGEGEVYEAN